MYYYLGDLDKRQESSNIPLKSQQLVTIIIIPTSLTSQTTDLPSDF